MPAYDKRMLNNQRLTQQITQLMLLTNKYFDEIMIMTDRSRRQLTYIQHNRSKNDQLTQLVLVMTEYTAINRDLDMKTMLMTCKICALCNEASCLIS